MVCHWSGIYFNGLEVGFTIFKEAVRRLKMHYPDALIWMKLSEVARYWAARELTRVERRPDRIELSAPFACPAFTIKTAANPEAIPRLATNGTSIPFREVMRPSALESGTWLRSGEDVTLCFDLPRGRSTILA
jgi:hypothetical protein